MGDDLVLALDVGNSTTGIAIFRGDELLNHWLVSSRRWSTSDESGLEILGIFQAAQLDFTMVRTVVLCSVVPAATQALEAGLERWIKTRPFTVTYENCPGIKIGVEEPSQVGPDRLANSVAAYHLHGGPVTVVDLGTATSFDVVSAQGEYLGGVITPGVTASIEDLFQRAARIPRIEIRPPKRVIGRTTEECVQSGVAYGTAGQIDGIVSRIWHELGTQTHVIATGGFSESLAELCNSITIVDPLLTLRGLHIIHGLAG